MLYNLWETFDSKLKIHEFNLICMTIITIAVAKESCG